MATRPRTQENLKLAVEAYIANERNYCKGADALGWDRMTFKRHVREAAKKGMLGTAPVLPGFEISKISTSQDADGNIRSTSVHQKPANGGAFNVPEGHKIKGVSAFLDAEGNVAAQWVKTREGELDPEYIAERIKAVLGDIPPVEPVAAPENTDADLLTLYPLADLHLGLYAWGSEADRNWDLATACKVYRDAMLRVSACSPSSSTAIVLGGGDYIHSNTNDNRTRSGNVLDADGRTDKVIDQAIELAVFQIDLALAKHEKVIVRFLKGNHDEYAILPIVFGLDGRYHNEPRVTIDKDPSLFWWHRFENNLLGGTHGHAAKISDMPLIMANRVPKDWGETEHRYIHMFHVHHKTQRIFEAGGVIAETHQSPVAQDAYHFGHGYLSGRSMQSITYHKQKGEVIRNRVALS